MPLHIQRSFADADPALPFPQVLCIGRAGSPELIAALRRGGADVIVAFDSKRGAQLLDHLNPQAILCAPTDAQAVRAYAEASAHIVVLGQGSGPTSPAAAGTRPASSAADVAQRILEDLAARLSRSR